MPQSSLLFLIPNMPFTMKPPCIPLFILALCVLVFYTALHRHQENHPLSSNQYYKNTLLYENTFLSSASNYTIATYLRHLTVQPHLAGTPPSHRTAQYVYNHFQNLGLSTHVTNYTTLLSYPTHSSLTAHFSNGSFVSLRLSEPGFSPNDVVIPYHAYSPSGTVYGEAVFLNYGREKDYRTLSAHGVRVKSCVGVVRRGGGMTRNQVVETAASHGVGAVVMYTEGGGSNDMFRTGVERGTVMKGIGDPQSPGWASVEGSERLALDDLQVTGRFPGIPSMPVSAEVAETILSSLEGARLPYEWRDSLGNGNKFGRVGPGPITLNFTYQGETKIATIQDVFSVIQGSEEPDRFVLLGNHRDAWSYGAVDPNSGTAALLDIARRYALLMRLGWNPKRTVILCSWDAEEFGMIGSTEWVEQNIVNLGSKSVAYLNVDCAVQGPGFYAGASPQLDDLLIEVTKKVKDPDFGNVMLYEKWKSSNARVHIQRLSGVDSDFAPFLQHAGVPSVDIYYGGGFPVYHTAFDSYDWMVRAGDPLFQRHVAVSGIWGLLALHLADDPILPFNYLSYAEELQVYTRVLSNLLEGSVSVHPITVAVEELMAAAKETEEEIKKLGEHGPVNESLLMKRRILNDRLILAERGFLDAEGIQGRQWFRHLIYGPHGDAESHLDFFPGVVDAISQSTRLNKRERKAAIEHEIWRVARAIQRASSALRGSLI